MRLRPPLIFPGDWFTVRRTTQSRRHLAARSAATVRVRWSLMKQSLKSTLTTLCKEEVPWSFPKGSRAFHWMLWVIQEWVQSAPASTQPSTNLLRIRSLERSTLTRLTCSVGIWARISPLVRWSWHRRASWISLSRTTKQICHNLRKTNSNYLRLWEHLGSITEWSLR